jgi:riboflavin transporter FmnP
MKTVAIAVVIVFAALTVVLNPALSGAGVPAPYAPYLVYQIWEIPIVAVYLLYGYKYGTLIAVMNAFILLALFIGPGGLPSAPFYNLAAILAMMVGVYIPHKIASLRANRSETEGNPPQFREKLIAVSTVLGITFRVCIMTIVNYIVLRYSYPIGYAMPEVLILGTLPLIALFNATLALYTIPMGYVISNAVKKNLKKFQ